MSTHREKETLFYCLIGERGETLGEAQGSPSPPCSSPASPPANPSSSRVRMHLLLLCV